MTNDVLITDELVEKVAEISCSCTCPSCLESARAALAVVVPEIVERCAKTFEQTVPAELEIEAAMNGDFDTRAMALAVRMVCGKIVQQKISSIRALGG